MQEKKNFLVSAIRNAIMLDQQRLEPFECIVTRISPSKDIFEVCDRYNTINCTFSQKAQLSLKRLVSNAPSLPLQAFTGLIGKRILVSETLIEMPNFKLIIGEFSLVSNEVDPWCQTFANCEMPSLETNETLITLFNYMLVKKMQTNFSGKQNHQISPRFPDLMQAAKNPLSIKTGTSPVICISSPPKPLSLQLLLQELGVDSALTYACQEANLSALKKSYVQSIKKLKKEDDELISLFTSTTIFQKKGVTDPQKTSSSLADLVTNQNSNQVVDPQHTTNITSLSELERMAQNNARLNQMAQLRQARQKQQSAQTTEKTDETVAQQQQIKEKQALSIQSPQKDQKNESAVAPPSTNRIESILAGEKTLGKRKLTERDPKQETEKEDPRKHSKRVYKKVVTRSFK